MSPKLYLLPIEDFYQGDRTDFKTVIDHIMEESNAGLDHGNESNHSLAGAEARGSNLAKKLVAMKNTSSETKNVCKSG